MFHCKLSWELLICNEWEVMARPASFLNFFFHFRSLLSMLMFLGVCDNQTVFTFIETLFFFGGEGRGTLKKFIRHELLVLCLLSWMEAYRLPAKERRVNFFCLSFWEVFKLQWYAFNTLWISQFKKESWQQITQFCWQNKQQTAKYVRLLLFVRKETQQGLENVCFVCNGQRYLRLKRDTI